ncbi:MBL fold metallo-hydrolase [Ralstonia pickettii]|nr:MBL fold metallo-hydrolase [Ralstonia pickettii]
MKLTVIGMWGGFPKKNGPCAGYLLEHNNFSLLIDCGSGVLVKLQEFKNLNNIHDVILSHYHYDHSSDIGAYMFSRLVNTQLGRVDKPLSIYGPYSPEKEEEISAVPYSDFYAIDDQSTLEIGPFYITFIKTIHPVETYGMKIECEGKQIVYTSDTSFIEELVDFAAGADLLITETSLYDGMDGEAFGHMTAKEAGILAARADAKQTLLTHLPHYGNLEELLISAKAQGKSAIKLAQPGLIWDSRVSP